MFILSSLCNITHVFYGFLLIVFYCNYCYIYFEWHWTYKYVKAERTCSFISITVRVFAVSVHINQTPANQWDFYYEKHIGSNRSNGKYGARVLRALFNTLNPELNPICYLLALLAHHFLHVSRIRVTSLNIRLLMSYLYIYIYIYICIYIYIEHLFLMFLDHTQRRTTVGRTPLDE